MITGAHVILYSKDAAADESSCGMYWSSDTSTQATAGSSSACLQPNSRYIRPRERHSQSST